jgi:hypothetical protein
VTGNGAVHDRVCATRERQSSRRPPAVTAHVKALTMGGFPDLTDLLREAETHAHHPRFDAAMQAFCRGLADFHSVGFTRHTGVVDTITWAVAILALYLDSHAPRKANASHIVAICADGGLAGATAVRNAISLLRRGGMIVVDDRRAAGHAHRLHPTPALLATMKDNLSIRLSAMEGVVAWPKPAAEWARTEGVLEAFVRGNVEAYRRERYVLYEQFPEIRAFMDRHCGYHILLDVLGRLEMSPLGASTVVPLSEVGERFGVSRTHVRKLFAAAATRGWFRFEPGGRLAIGGAFLARCRLWFGLEFAWARRLVGSLRSDPSATAQLSQR